MDIPLFPLPNLVLFPHIVVPLHIFEERYKLMINSCVERDEPFGLVLLRNGADSENEDTIHRVGVSARIVEVERLDGGRLNILCEGESRHTDRVRTETEVARNDFHGRAPPHARRPSHRYPPQARSTARI